MSEGALVSQRRHGAQQIFMLTYVHWRWRRALAN
jgi:hypothetical protein